MLRVERMKCCARAQVRTASPTQSMGRSAPTEPLIQVPSTHCHTALSQVLIILPQTADRQQAIRTA